MIASAVTPLVRAAWTSVQRKMQRNVPTVRFPSGRRKRPVMAPSGGARDDFVSGVAEGPGGRRLGQGRMFDLSSKTALVTGATGGIGGAVARALHARGATVGVSGTRRENLEKLAQEL